MGKPVAGEVVVLPFPQTDLQVGKRRPALVVANLTGADVVLCQITSQARGDPYSILLVDGDFERGRLNVDRFIRTNRLFTVDQSVNSLLGSESDNCEAQRSSCEDPPAICLTVRIERPGNNPDEKGEAKQTHTSRKRERR